MEQNPLDPAAELRRIARILTRLDPEAVQEAETALNRVIETLRHWSSPEFLWPARELAVCREMVVTSNQLWERRRTTIEDDRSMSSSQHWIG